MLYFINIQFEQDVNLHFRTFNDLSATIYKLYHHFTFDLKPLFILLKL